MIDFPVALPVGVRTSCDLPRKTGKFQHTWLDTDVPEHVDEHAKLVNGDLHPRLKKREHLDALGQLRSLKTRAARGQLPVSRDNTGRARIMQSVPYLLELRPAFNQGNPPPRLIRLYYAEPAQVQGALLPLVLSTKPNGPDPLGEQNASLQDAKARSRLWLLTRQSSRATRR